MMTLSDARTLIDGGRQKAEELGQRAVIAVLDANGHIVSLDRMDGVRLFRDRFAIGKALAAVAFEQPTSEVATVYESNPARFLSVLNVFSGDIYLSGGGLPVAVGGEVWGGIGVAGASRGVDDTIAEAGISYWQTFRGEPLV